MRALEHGHRAVSLVQAITKAEEGPVHIAISSHCDWPRLHHLLEKAEKSVAGEYRYEGLPIESLRGIDTEGKKEESYTLGHFRARSFRHSVSFS